MARPPPTPVYHHEDAERLAEHWMRWAGFRDARKTPRGPDRGIDVRASGAVAQVKLHERPIGRPALQQLHGAAVSEGKPSLFFSYAGYSDQALEFGNSVGMALFRFDLSGVVRPVNRRAATIARAAEGLGPPVSSQAKMAFIVIGALVGVVVALVLFTVNFPESTPFESPDCLPLIGVTRDCPGLFDAVGPILGVGTLSLAVGLAIWAFFGLALPRVAQVIIDRRYRRGLHRR